MSNEKEKQQGGPPAPGLRRAGAERRQNSEKPLLVLLNPFNPAIEKRRDDRIFLTRSWSLKPLSLFVLAGITPNSWEVRVVDENARPLDLSFDRKPTLAGITAFTSQAERAYELADKMRASGVPVVMGGIHASFCPEEALKHADSVVIGEAEGVWREVLDDARNGGLKRLYRGEHTDLKGQMARHSIPDTFYRVGAMQTARGCPFNCSFCSVTAFNGGRFRFRPIEEVVKEMRQAPEGVMLLVDDNLVGVTPAHHERAKELFRAIIRAKIRKWWVTQVTTHFGDDPEFCRLAAKAGCLGVFIGFESPHDVDLQATNKHFNVRGIEEVRRRVRNIQRAGVVVDAAFIIGLDTQKPGIAREIDAYARTIGVDAVNIFVMTPLPGTRLFDQLAAEGRIVMNNYPVDWRYYTLMYPTVRFRNFSWSQMVDEYREFVRLFYTRRRIIARLRRCLRRPRQLLFATVGNFSIRATARASVALLEEYVSRADPAATAACPAAPADAAGATDTVDAVPVAAVK